MHALLLEPISWGYHISLTLHCKSLSQKPHPKWMQFVHEPPRPRSEYKCLGPERGGEHISRCACCMFDAFMETHKNAGQCDESIHHISLPRISRFHGGAHLKMHSLTFCENTDFLGIRIVFGYWAKDSNFKTPLNWFILHFHNFHIISEKSYSMTFRHCVGMPEFLHLGHFRCFR